MKMMSKRATNLCDLRLDRVRSDLQACIKAMEGKYGTAEEVSNLKCAMIFLKYCFLDDESRMKVYQKFRNPPNTPKSRRLGWHKEGAIDEQ